MLMTFPVQHRLGDLNRQRTDVTSPPKAMGACRRTRMHQLDVPGCLQGQGQLHQGPFDPAAD